MFHMKRPIRYRDIVYECGCRYNVWHCKDSCPRHGTPVREEMSADVTAISYPPHYEKGGEHGGDD